MADTATNAKKILNLASVANTFIFLLSFLNESLKKVTVKLAEFPIEVFPQCTGKLYQFRDVSIRKCLSSEKAGCTGLFTTNSRLPKVKNTNAKI